MRLKEAVATANMADKNEQIGPQLPPHMRKPVETNNDENIDEKDEGGSISFELASPGTSASHKRDQPPVPAPVVCNDQPEVFGPKLPPGLGKKATNISIGPALPPEWESQIVNDNEEEDEAVIGPLPSSSGAIDDDLKVKHEIESRARAMKDRLQGKTKETTPKREAWMTELPPELGANIGIVARTFKKRTLNTSESDRSVWTDTPQDRERKSRERIMKKPVSEQVVADPVERQRDIEMKKKVEEHNTQYRSSSLMEMHQEERKKKKGDGPIERRPFDRSTDLDLKKIDKRAASTFIKGAKGMNSKFENAKFESKYL